jgi:hypothetical protein
MISRRLLGPIAVIVLAAIELTTPREARASAGQACGIEYFIQCQSMSIPQQAQFCNSACPTWIWFVCDTDTGGLRCLYDPF